jgi:hypothetical protein
VFAANAVQVANEQYLEKKHENERGIDPAQEMVRRHEFFASDHLEFKLLRRKVFEHVGSRSENG